MIVHADIEQRSPEWYALRLGMPTASEFSKLVQADGKPSKTLPTYAVTLAGELFAGKGLDIFEGSAWTDRGRELEAEAMRMYEFSTDAEIKTVAFVTDDAKTAGCSPDALVGDDGMVEVKCLKAENHIKAILYYQKHGHCPPDYVQQTQGQIMICERQWCDLIFYHPELPQLILRQVADPALQDALRKGIADVGAERDRVLAALNEQISPTRNAA
jgi:hypothetical protein